MRRPITGTLTLLLATALAGAQPAPPAETAAAPTIDAVERVRDALASLRSLLVMYSIQHGDRPPAADAMTEWGALLRTTTPEGRFTVNGMLGPYLAGVPENALTGSASLLVAGPGVARLAEAGWVYDPRTGSLRAVIPASAATVAGRVLNADDYVVSRP
jgi:hypothetical protein